MFLAGRAWPAATVLGRTDAAHSAVHQGLGTRVNLPVAYTCLLLRHRYRVVVRPGSPMEARALAMVEKLSAPELAQARAAADAWQPGQPLPGES